MTEKPIEYEFVLKDGSKRYETVYDRKEVFVFQKMHDATIARPVAPLSVASLNDDFRSTFLGGSIVLTSGVAALPLEARAVILERIRAFDTFEEGNDPHGEHDFGQVEHDGESYLFKIDYLDPTMTKGSEDPANTEITRRVLTVLRADEY
jgi:hypothetical protein